MKSLSLLQPEPESHEVLVDKYSDEVADILECFPNIEAFLITDESQIGDFMPTRHNHGRLYRLMGRTVAPREYVGRLAGELHMKRSDA